jgi:hypothetical protein
MKPTRMLVAALAAAGLVLLCACGKKEEAPPPVRGAEAAPPQQKAEARQPDAAEPRPAASAAPDHVPGQSLIHAPTDYIRINVQALDKAKKVVGLTQLQQAEQVFFVEKGRHPASLDELAKYRGAPLPVLPNYYRYDYDPQTGKIDLADARAEDTP